MEYAQARVPAQNYHSHRQHGQHRNRDGQKITSFRAQSSMAAGSAALVDVAVRLSANPPGAGRTFDAHVPAIAGQSPARALAAETAASQRVCQRASPPLMWSRFLQLP